MKIFNRKILIFFLIFAQNIDCGYTLEPPRRGGYNEYPQSMFWSKNKKNMYTSAYNVGIPLHTPVVKNENFQKNKKNRYTPAYPSFAI